MISAVTGGTGFIGSHLVEALAARGDTVRVLSRNDLSNGEPGITNHVVDFTCSASFQTALTGCDRIFHLAAALRAPRQSDLITINRNNAKTLVAAIHQFVPTAKVVYCSSQAAAGPARNGKPRSSSDPAEPISIYGKSKRAAEEIFESDSELHWTILRPSAVFGPRERDIFVFFKALARGWSSQIGTVQRRFSWIFVHDFVAALLLASETEALARRTEFVISGDTDWNEFRAAASSALGGTYHLMTLPQWVAGLVATGGEVWSRLSGKPVLLNRDKISELSYPDWRCDDGSFRQRSGYAPQYNLNQAIAETIAWYRAENWL